MNTGMSLFNGEWVQYIASLLLTGFSWCNIKVAEHFSWLEAAAYRLTHLHAAVLRMQRRRTGLDSIKYYCKIKVSAQCMLPELSPSLSADMDLTSSSTRRTSEATCSARTLLGFSRRFPCWQPAWWLGRPPGTSCAGSGSAAAPATSSLRWLRSRSFRPSSAISSSIRERCSKLT